MSARFDHSRLLQLAGVLLAGTGVLFAGFDVAGVLIFLAIGALYGVPAAMGARPAEPRGMAQPG